jgi:hypothetical protein
MQPFHRKQLFEGDGFSKVKGGRWIVSSSPLRRTQELTCSGLNWLLPLLFWDSLLIKIFFTEFLKACGNLILDFGYFHPIKRKH